MDTQQVPLITIWVVMTVLAAVTVGMRFYTRRLILHILGPEDWLILVSMVSSLKSHAHHQLTPSDLGYRGMRRLHTS
jgi:hypothetical protein